MARFAPVMPMQLIEEMQNHEDGWDLIGAYHLWLAHDVLASENQSVRYGELSDYIHSNADDAYIIMDNSIVELGDAMGMEPVVRAAELCNAHCVVMPDVMGDGKETIAKFNDGFAAANSRTRSAGLDLMLVPQGPTIEDFVYCLEEYADVGADVIGIPRIATGQLGSRRDLIEITRSLMPNARIHLLGFSDDVVDDLLCTKLLLPHEGIDSAVPVRAGWRGDDFRFARSDYGKRGNYWETAELTPTIISNILYVREAFSAR